MACDYEMSNKMPGKYLVAILIHVNKCFLLWSYVNGITVYTFFCITFEMGIIYVLFVYNVLMYCIESY